MAEVDGGLLTETNRQYYEGAQSFKVIATQLSYTTTFNTNLTCIGGSVTLALKVDRSDGAGQADMIVLNHNLLEIPATDIHKTEVQKTVFKGKVVYQKE